MKIKPNRSKKKRKFRVIDQTSRDTQQQTNLTVVANHNDLYYLSNEDEGGGEGGDIGYLEPIGFNSELADGTEAMEIERRLLEQEGEKQFAKVHARDKTQSNSNGLGQVLKQHPNELFESQLFAGDFSPTDFAPGELEDYMRDRAEQEKEKQLRLEKVLQNQNEYTNNFTPTPSGP